MLYVYVRVVMDVMFYVYIVTRGSVGASSFFSYALLHG